MMRVIRDEDVGCACARALKLTDYRQTFVDIVQEDALNCSCCWSKDAETDRALLCVAGRDAKIKVYDVKEGKIHTTLVGHGGVRTYLS